MEPKKFSTIVTAWRSALQVRSFRFKISITFALLIACAAIAPLVFQYVQQRKGEVLNDSILTYLPAFDLSLWIFLLLYSLIFMGIISLIKDPSLFLVALQAYVLLTVFRFITLLLTPLEPPVNIVELGDPFVQHLFYQQVITKDLFFSGHTSLLVLLSLASPNQIIRNSLVVGTLFVAFMLLIQHAHYTVDILFAPLFAWLAFRGSLAFSKRLGI